MLALCFLGLTSLHANAQSSLNFGNAQASDQGAPGTTTGNVFNGMAATTFNNKFFSVFTDDPNDRSSPCPGGLSVQGYASQPNQPPSWVQTIACDVPLPDGQPQMTTFNGAIYIAYAAQGSDQLVIASSRDGENFSAIEPGIQVYPRPAIGTFNNQLYVAYQQHSSSHYLGLASSFDGSNFSNTVYQNFRIGHSPAITQFGNKLVIAAFCQCDSHYLDTYVSTDGANFSMYENRSQTLSNLSAPSLTVYNNVLALAYVHNGTNDIYTSTSYDGVNWTGAVRQSALNFSLGGSALTVVNGQITIVYESERALGYDPRSGAHQEYYSTSGGVQ